MAIVEAGTPLARAAATPPAPHSARVLWREVPDWHTLPGDPAVALNKGARAYARAGTLHAAPAAGRLTDKVA